MNPFAVLNLPCTCTDQEVRDAYHRLLRRYPPEKCPEQFQQIQEAAAALRTERDRWRAHLLRRPEEISSPMQTLQRFARLPGRVCPPGFPVMKSLLRACAAAARKEAEPDK